MVKKSTGKTTFRKRIFRNLGDILDFEERIIDKELGIKWSKNKQSNTEKYNKHISIDSYMTNPNTNKTVHIDPDDKEALEHFEKIGYIKGWEQYQKEMSQVSHQLSRDPKKVFFFESEPIIFKDKGKMPSSVSYLRVFIESSIGENTPLHIINNATKFTKL